MNASEPQPNPEQPEAETPEASPEAAAPQNTPEELAAAAAQAGIELAAGNAEEMAALQEQLAQAKDQAIRAAAEVENMRKRTAREMEEAKKFAISGFAKELIDVLDNLHRASQSVSEEAVAENGHLKSLATGVDMTLKSLQTAFEKFGIQRIDPMGEKFDHNLHQALAQVEESDAEAGTVVQVMQAGYTLHGRLLRPAMVAVAKGGQATTLDTQA